MKFGVNENVNKIISVPQTKNDSPTPPKPFPRAGRGNENRGSVNHGASLNVGELPNSVNVLPTLGGAITVGFLIAKYVI